MKLNRIMGLAIVTSVAATMAIAGTSKMDFAKMYEKECQGCHGPIHQGGVGSDLRPAALKKKEHYKLVETILINSAKMMLPVWLTG